MKLNTKIVLSALAATMISFTGCGDSGSSTPPATVIPDTNTTDINTTDTNTTIVNFASHPTYLTYDTANVDTTTLSGDITTDTTLKSGKQYKVDGLVKVKNGATLTIEPGTVVFGDTTGDDFIVITKGSKIMAEGTAT
ncbi:hypothetical protein KKG72_00380, partial [bacterium]|nr:hypothetical protein [bacterium]MBU1993301.1 hypothetical protein [bacterium]